MVSAESILSISAIFCWISAWDMPATILSASEESVLVLVVEFVFVFVPRTTPLRFFSGIEVLDDDDDRVDLNLDGPPFSLPVPVLVPLSRSVLNFPFRVSAPTGISKDGNPVLVLFEAFCCCCHLLSVDEVKGGWQVTWKITVEIESQEKPACVAEVIFRSYE